MNTKRLAGGYILRLLFCVLIFTCNSCSQKKQHEHIAEVDKPIVEADFLEKCANGQIKLEQVTIIYINKNLWLSKDVVLLAGLVNEIRIPSMPFLDANITGKRIYSTKCIFKTAGGENYEYEASLNIFLDRIYLSIYFNNEGFTADTRTIRLDSVIGVDGNINFEQLRTNTGINKSEFRMWSGSITK